MKKSLNLIKFFLPLLPFGSLIFNLAVNWGTGSAVSFVQVLSDSDIPFFADLFRNLFSEVGLTGSYISPVSSLLGYVIFAFISCILIDFMSFLPVFIDGFFDRILRRNKDE